MKTLQITLSLLLCSMLSFGQIQSYTGSITDGSITISPDGLSSKYSGKKYDKSNVALGANALLGILPGTDLQSLNNTGIGYYALFKNSKGYNNSANGSYALNMNTTGNNNTANGKSALYNNTTGNYNTAYGSSALFSNTSGINNTASGPSALAFNTTGSANSANGSSALYNNTSGFFNTGNGVNTLLNNKTGHNNTAIGSKADVTIDGLSNIIAIGYDAKVDASNKIRMGNTDITAADIQVAWHVTSDKRWKENIESVPLGLDFIKDLKPVAYHRINNEKKDIEFGIIAQEMVETLKKYGFNETDLGLVNKDEKGYYSFRYNDLLAPMIKAIQEQQEIIEKQNNKLASQAGTLDLVLQRLKRLENQSSILSVND